MEIKDDGPVVEQLLRLLRINTVAGQGGYMEAVDLLESWLREIPGIETSKTEFVTGKPVLVATFTGSDPSLPSLLLNGHYDVVPAEAGLWSVPPFAAEVQIGGDEKIMARGSQDMKSVLVQYVAAMQRLVRSPLFKPRRTIHLSFLPDEEVGGADGAARFVDSEFFKQLKVGIALDEGLANPKPNALSVFYGERAACWVTLRARGPVGHGSRFVENTAIEKMTRILHRIYADRASLSHQCHHNHASLGSLLSMNVTSLKAGVPSFTGGGFAVNVIPSEAEISVDIRVPLTEKDIETIIRQEWIKDEKDIDIVFLDKNDHPDETLLSQPVERDKWITAVSKGIKNVLPNVDIELDVFPAGTDGRYIRRAGIPCIGFSPIRNTPILLHDNDEYITKQTFLQGVQVYCEIIKQLTIYLPKRNAFIHQWNVVVV